MDKLSKSILWFMASHSKDDVYKCSLHQKWDYMSDVSVSVLADSAKASLNDTLSAIAYLVEQNLAQYVYLDTEPIAFCLKHQGLHYRELSRLTQKEKWKERIISFFSGVAVTVLAGLLIQWLSR